MFVCFAFQNSIATFSVQNQIQTKQVVDALSLKQAFKQTALMDCVLAHGRSVGTRQSLKHLPTPIIPWFYEIYHKTLPP